MNSSRPTRFPARARLIRLIHIAKRDLDMTDDSYRSLLQRHTRKDSSAKMNLAELDQVLIAMRALGWSPKPPKKKYSPTSRNKQPELKTQADKIRAMWISLNRAGVVHNPSEASLSKFCKRLTGKHSPDWLTHEDAVIVIQALEAWAKRERVPEAVRL